MGQGKDMNKKCFCGSGKKFKDCCMKMSEQKISHQGTKTYTARNGISINVGDTGVIHSEFQFITYDEKTGLAKTEILPSAKELWNITINEINSAIEINSRFIIKSCLFSLVTGFEIYTKNLAIELDKKGKCNNCQDLLTRFAKNCESEAEEEAKKQHITVLQYLINERRINFQNFDDTKRTYNKAFHIVFGEMFDSELITRLKKYFSYRHILMHINPLISLLEIDVDLNKNLIEKMKEDLCFFIEKLDSKANELA